MIFLKNGKGGGGKGGGTKEEGPAPPTDFQYNGIKYVLTGAQSMQVIVVTKQGLLKSWLWQTKNKKCSVGHNSL